MNEGERRPVLHAVTASQRQRRLASLPTRIATADTRGLKPPPNRAPAELLTREYRTWRTEVLRRAGHR